MATRTFRLKVGFQETTDVPDALAQAVADWHEAVTRAGWTAVGEPSTLVVTDDPDRAALGEYVVDVVGGYSDGDL